MKATEKILRYAMISFLAISVIYFVVSFVEFLSLEDQEPFLKQIYNSIKSYAGLHSFTIAVIAAYWGVVRLRISLESKQTEMKDKTIKLCEKYFTDIQISFKELIQNEHYSGIPLIWSKLTEVNRKSLKTDYKSSHDKIQNAEKQLKSQSLLTLYKLEAFSAAFLHGNTDLELGRKIIGETFCKQVGFLLGLIAYYRPEGSEELFGNTLNLKEKWS